MIFQRDRVYELVVGTDERAVKIGNNLNIRFKAVKSSDNKERKNEAFVEVYNLSKENRNLFEQPYTRVELKVGYFDTDLVTVFTGQVTNVSSSNIKPFLTGKTGTTMITKLDIDELYNEINNTITNFVVPNGKKVRDVILEVIKRLPEVTRHELGGRNIDKVVVDGFPVTGTPRRVLDSLSREYNIEWQIEQGVLYVSDVGGTYTEDREKVPLIGQMSGLIGRPEFVNEDSKRLQRLARSVEDGVEPPKEKNPKKNSLRIRILLNPKIKAGSIVKLEFEELSGFYKVDSITHEGEFRGNDWHSTLICTEKLD